MPYKIEQIGRSRRYRVTNAKTNRVASYGSSLVNARTQVRILCNEEHNPESKAAFLCRCEADPYRFPISLSSAKSSRPLYKSEQKKFCEEEWQRRKKK